jgi:hypothetical protein
MVLVFWYRLVHSSRHEGRLSSSFAAMEYVRLKTEMMVVESKRCRQIERCPQNNAFTCARVTIGAADNVESTIASRQPDSHENDDRRQQRL